MSSNLRSSVPTSSSEIFRAVKRCKTAIVGVAVFSGTINVLTLTSSIYMLQLYDRVIPSHSVVTLIGLTALMLLLYAIYGVLDVVRTRVMSRIGLRIDRALRDRVFELVLMLPLRLRSQGDGLQPIGDLDQIRGFLAGSGPIALFDLPWIPFYLGLVFLLHPWLGLLGLAGAFLLVGLTMLTELRSRAPTKSMSQSSSARHVFSEAGRRNAESVNALGMAGRLTQVWSGLNDAYLLDQCAASDVAATYGTISKVLRLVLQSLVLGLGAYLVILGQATGGVMIAASILISRALAPIEIAIANWRGFLAARQSTARLQKLLDSLPASTNRLELPKPSKELQIDGLWIAAPGQQRPIVQNVSFALEAGAGLGIIGPSASGKSTLARAVVGAWLPMRGHVRLDGAALDQWSPGALGTHVGYLPQEIELFDGSVADNIARFDPQAPASAIVEAAKAAGVHDLVVRLPEGYETKIGEGGALLSAGQRQRLGLARALYGDPFLVVLDEPNSNLDSEGDAALTQAIQSVRARSGIAIVIAHRPSALASLDQILVMAGGQALAFGPKDEVLRAAVQSQTQQSSRLKVVSETPAEAR